MFGSCTIATGTGTQFLYGTRLLSPGNSRSSSSGTMSFTTAGRPRCPSRVKIKAFTETTTGSSSSSSRRRIEVRNSMAPNLYEVLRVKESATQVEIKTAYRTLAKLYHPDAATPGSDPRDFIEIHSAYATLSDPTARAHYDLSIGSRRHLGFASSSSSSSSSSSYAAAAGTGGTRSGFIVGRTRRWETDQCW